MPSNDDAAKTVSYRKKKLHKYTQHVVTATSGLYLSRMEKFKSNGFFRENMFGHEIVWNDYRYTFEDKKLTSKQKVEHTAKKKSMFIFALVKRDASKYIKRHKIVPTAWLPSTTHNDNFKKKNAAICGTDLDGAYWRIARQMGVISEKTYQHGMRIKDKTLCLAALANLGADKPYRVIAEGKLTHRVVILKGSDILKEVYKRIRHTCFEFMQGLAGMLGNDFVIYKTDCIFYVRKQANVRLVTSFLEDHELDYKMIGKITPSQLRKS